MLLEYKYVFWSSQSKIFFWCYKYLSASIWGVLGAPFLTEESANEFMRLKRQNRYSQNYWDPSSKQNAWGYAVAEQVFSSIILQHLLKKKKVQVWDKDVTVILWGKGGNLFDLSTHGRLLNSHSYLCSIRAQNIFFCSELLQVSESWTALRDTAQYYMDLGSLAFDPLIARYDGISQQSIL